MFGTFVSDSSELYLTLCPREICQFKKTENNKAALDLKINLISFEE